MHEPGAVNRHQRVGHTNRETCQDRPVESTTGVDRRFSPPSNWKAARWSRFTSTTAKRLGHAAGWK